MRWLLLAVAVVCLLGIWFTQSAWIFGWGLVLGFVAAFAAALAFAHARIEGHEPSRTLSGAEIEALQQAVRDNRETPSEPRDRSA